LTCLGDTGFASHMMALKLLSLQTVFNLGAGTSFGEVASRFFMYTAVLLLLYLCLSGSR